MADEPTPFCTNCGALLEPDAHFCGVCGHARAGEPAAVAAPHGPVAVGAPPTVPARAVAPPAVTPAAPPPAIPPPAVPPPAVPPPAGAPPVVARPTGAPARPPGNGVLVVVGVIAAIALVAAIAVIVIATRPDDAAADELVLEPVAYQTEDPFTPAVTASPEAPPPAAALKVAPSGQPAGGQQVTGAQPGLYGGTKDNAACDAGQLVAYLQGNADKAQAWAGVLGIGPGDIAGYVRGLTPVLLTRDTRVTNHGFAGGRATAVPAVLQAGTAVMVDRFGVPRVKCGCGNPLTEPAPVTGATRVRGTPWTGFTVATTVVVTVTVQVTTFVLVDVGTGLVFVRPPGSTGKADAEPSKDERCRALPADPDCPAATAASSTSTSSSPSTSSSTSPATSNTSVMAPPTTAPPSTVAPTSAPTTAPGEEPDDAGGTAIGAVRDAVGGCGQGGSLGQFSAIEVRAFVFRVSVPVTFEGADEPVTASWLVDLTSGRADVVPEDPAAAALICVGG